jgi:hypothetical protein
MSAQAPASDLVFIIMLKAIEMGRVISVETDLIEK